MPSALKKEIKMRKTILTILGSALLAASTVQIAAAAEHHQARKVVRAPVTSTERARNANAYAWPPAAAQSQYEERGASYYEGRGISAPAGR
jgi:hypothetical protein